MINFKDWVLNVQSNGVGEIIITSIDSDGKGKGFDLYLAEEIQKHVNTFYS